MTSTEPIPAAFVSAYTGLNGFQVGKLPASERRALWEADRQRIADLWFDGDVDRADAVLDTMPYSTIPDWSDVDRAARAITGGA